MTEPPPDLPAPGRPAAIRVLGILDLVFAAIGIIGILLDLYAAARPFQSGVPLDPNQSWWHIFGGSFSFHIVIALLMLIAGIKLVKNRRDAIRASNRYATASLSVKGFSIVLGFMELSRMRLGVGVVEMIYPLLCLILLNRPGVREWLSANGT